MPRLVFKGTDTPVSLIFKFTGDFAADGLNTFTDIKVNIGDEEYNLAGGKVVVVSPTELEINISAVTELAEGTYPLTVRGYTAKYSLGYVLVHTAINQYMTVGVHDIT